MATPAQQLASRANGALSNGPSSVEGKAISSRNSFKLGITAQAMIIPGEDPAELERLTAEFHRTFQAVGPVETAFLEGIIRAHWMKNRYSRIETEVIALRAAALPDCEHPVGAAFEQDATSGNTLLKLFRRQQAADRDFRRNLELLRELQNARRADELEQQRLSLRQPGDKSSPGALEVSLARVRFNSEAQPADPLQPGAPSVNVQSTRPLPV